MKSALVAVAAVVAAADTCASDRPGAETHRVLHVPRAYESHADVAMWTAKLCCVYAWTLFDSGDRYLITYDGLRHPYFDDTFSEVASNVFDDICAMPMGVEDCGNRTACIEAAENATAPPTVAAPTAAPSVASDAAVRAGPRAALAAAALLLFLR